MNDAPTHCCEQMRYAVSTAKIPVIFIHKFREYGIKVIDGGTGFIEIQYCPWCGKQLPMSLRDEWFDALEKLGINPLEEENLIPSQFLDGSWYQNIK